MSDTHRSAVLPPIKGSWEDQLFQAQQLVSQQNDSAIPIFQKLLDRLGLLPAAQRAAANGRLEQILRRAAIDLIYFLTYRERYDEALATITQVKTFLEENELAQWDRHAIYILVQAGQIDSALERLRALAATGVLDDWGDMLFIALDHNRLEDAVDAVRQADAMLNKLLNQEQDPEVANVYRGYVAILKSRLALAQGNIQESMAWFEHAAAMDKRHRNHPQPFYTQVLDKGYYDEALTLIRRDSQNPMRAGFWAGLALKRQGDAAAAERQWFKVIQTKLPEQGDVDLLELVLAHYFLGDKKGVGLGMTLNTIQEEPEAFWGLYFLAGLGWALRGDMTTARSDLRLAVMRHKSMAQGARLERHWGRIAADLLGPETYAALAEFFEQ